MKMRTRDTGHHDLPGHPGEPTSRNIRSLHPLQLILLFITLLPAPFLRAQTIYDMGEINGDLRIIGAERSDSLKYLTNIDFDANGQDDYILSLPGHHGIGKISIFLDYAPPLRSSFLDLLHTSPDISIVGGPVRGVTQDIGDTLISADFNGDGVPDFVTSDYIHDYAYCYFGSPSWTSGTHLQIPADPPDLTIHHDGEGAGYPGHFGQDVASGDVNGDGIADIIIGELYALNHSDVGTGAVHVVYGRSSFAPPQVIDLSQTPADITIFGAGYADQLGYRVASGDVNGDGIDDIVAGSRWGRADDFGRVYVIYGSTGFPQEHLIDLAMDTPDIEIRGREYYSATGDIVGVADLNGDGRKDICFNAGLIDTIPDRRGVVFVVYGQDFPSGHFIDLETEQADLEIIGDAFEVSYLGYDMTGGDMDGDGCEELVLTAFSCAERQEDEGVVYVLPGSRHYPPHLSLDFSVDAPALKILGYQEFPMNILSKMQDMNGDGLKDLICSSPGAWRDVEPDVYWAGHVYVILSDGNLFDPPAFLASPGFYPSSPPELRLYDAFYNETWMASFSPYLVQGYGLVSSGGDLDGDGNDELITGPGPGPYHPALVQVLDREGERLAAFQAYGTPRYGVLVSSGDLDGDGVDEIVTGAGPGAVYGPHVRGWRWDGGETVSPLPGVSFLAYGTNRWGANVACGDIDGDGADEIVTGAGPGDVFGPHVRGWRWDGEGLVSAMPGVSFFAYGTLRWGVNVACGDIDGDGIDEIVTGPGPSEIFSSHVRGWDYDGEAVAPIDGVSFIAYPNLPHSMGCTVACGDVDNDRVAEILTGPGPHPANPAWLGTWNYDGKALSLVESKTFLVFEEGDYVGGARIALGNLRQQPEYLPE